MGGIYDIIPSEDTKCYPKRYIWCQTWVICNVFMICPSDLNGGWGLHGMINWHAQNIETLSVNLFCNDWWCFCMKIACCHPLWLWFMTWNTWGKISVLYSTSAIRKLNCNQSNMIFLMKSHKWGRLWRWRNESQLLTCHSGHISGERTRRESLLINSRQIGWHLTCGSWI